MSRKLYVTTKLFIGGRRLIGILSEVDGQFQFEYKLGNKRRESFCYLDEFPVQDKVYVGAEADKFVYRMIPRKDHRFINELLASANLKEYNVWEMLKVFGQRNVSKQDAYLYEALPEGTVIYEELDSTQ
jgi:hypothetical protein